MNLRDIRDALKTVLPGKKYTTTMHWMEVSLPTLYGQKIQKLILYMEMGEC